MEFFKVCTKNSLTRFLPGPWPGRYFFMTHGDPKFLNYLLLPTVTRQWCFLNTPERRFLPLILLFMLRNSRRAFGGNIFGLSWGRRHLNNDLLYVTTRWRHHSGWRLAVGGWTRHPPRKKMPRWVDILWGFFSLAQAVARVFMAWATALLQRLLLPITFPYTTC